MLKRTLHISLVMVLTLTMKTVASSHAGYRAYFTVRPQQKGLVVEVRIHEHDLTTVLAVAKACDPGQDKTICTAEYIRSHFNAFVNGKPLSLMFISSAHTKSDEVYLFSVSDIDLSSIKTITIVNTCFVTVQPKFENIVRFLLKDDVSYSMSDRRRSITHTF
ncbi:MAG: hypothetical protein IPI24_04910 [Ignavibacteria bacterium]|nr:hypothetical protein [Ignavibacteria bacterium]MBK6419799.1 hypothetical protein [Ignavibacteria bacterium]MBK7576759.1 hypothetical protein [Ignavibacteria bacterium]